MTDKNEPSKILEFSHSTTHFRIICNLTIHCSGHNVGHNVPKLLNRSLSDGLLSRHNPTLIACNLEINVKVNYHFFFASLIPEMQLRSTPNHLAHLENLFED